MKSNSRKKLRKYTKEEVLAYWTELLKTPETKRAAMESLMDWVDEGHYKIMKKYTIVYAVTGNRGSNHWSSTTYDRVETDNLAELLKSNKYDAYVWFVFEGWPKVEGEKDKSQKNETTMTGEMKTVQLTKEEIDLLRSLLKSQMKEYTIGDFSKICQNIINKLNE